LKQKLTAIVTLTVLIAQPPGDWTLTYDAE